MTTVQVAPTPTAPDPRDPEDRLERFFDPDSVELLAPRDTSGVVAARGLVHGSRAIAFCTDATVMGGAMGADGCRHIVDAIETAVSERVPVIGIWHSGGARLAEGVVALHAVGEVFAAMVRASGRVPQISIVLGPAAGRAAYGPALTDLVIMGPAGRVFVTGPDVVRSVTGEVVDQEQLGGPDTHGRRSGVVHVVTDSEPEALETARTAVDLLAAQGAFAPAADEADVDLRAFLPEQPQRAYDVKPLVAALLDGASGELGGMARALGGPRLERHALGHQGGLDIIGRSGVGVDAQLVAGMRIEDERRRPGHGPHVEVSPPLDLPRLDRPHPTTVPDTGRGLGWCRMPPQTGTLPGGAVRSRTRWSASGESGVGSGRAPGWKRGGSHAHGNQLFEPLGFGVAQAPFPICHHVAGGAQPLGQAHLREADGGAQRQHQLAEGIVALPVDMSLHERSPALA